MYFEAVCAIMRFIIEDNIKKFYPTVEESRVNNKVKCTEDGCNNVFVSESNLNLHLVKTHKRSNLMSDSMKKQYFCPESGCSYNAEKCFKELKTLRTHYMVKHSQEQYICLRCNKVFPLQKILSRHAEYCGVIFTCPQCPANYAVYETLQTHGRRKNHTVPVKSFYKQINTKSNTVVPGNLRPILPKNCFTIVLVANPTTTSSQESQTYAEIPTFKSKTTQVPRRPENQYNQHTQTGTKNQVLTVETQTMGSVYNLPRKNNAVLDNTLTQRSSDTQTDTVESKNSSCNTSVIKDEFLVKNNVVMNSSSTQTGVSSNYSSSTHTHDSIYTDTSDLLTGDMSDNISSFEFDNCHMQTQTESLLEDAMFNCDYMSNMYTQTCDEILNDLGFSDIQTQTAIDDILKSVESQTVMSSKKQENSERDMTHMETQTTEEVFREMLEVINS